jgi:putative tricarboxylic transport membrane protein
MNRVETAAGVLVLAVGASLLVAASRFPFLLQGIPGPGFLPLLISFGIIGAGLVLIVAAYRGGRPEAKAIPWPPPSGWARVGLMLAAMTASFLLLEALGFVVVTVLFMAVMVYCLGERSWRILATVPLLSAIGLYLVFAVWLRVPLPKGIITFLG